MFKLLSSLTEQAAAYPWLSLLVFIAATLLIVWRLEALSAQGVEGSVLGTLIMPYCSGLGNILFAVILGRRGGDSLHVAVNCVFNNLTNMTLLVGLPVLIWSMQAVPKKGSRKKQQEARAGRLSLSLNLVAAVFFAWITWALLKDGELNRQDGLVLLASFLFWQCFHVYDVKKSNLLQNKKYPRGLPLDLLVLLIGALALYFTTDGLVQWFESIDPDHIPREWLGWLSGILMVMPNALLAFYYGFKKRTDVVYISQSGDGHICIPLCLGLFALFQPVGNAGFIQAGLVVLMLLNGIHLVLLLLFGRLPRWLAALLPIAFAWFIFAGWAGDTPL